MAFEAEWITDEERFGALAEPWDRLAGPMGSPFALHRWYQAWWGAFGAPGALRVLALWDGDRLAGALPLRQVGGELHWLANWHTPATAPLHDGDEVLDRLVREAVGAKRRLLLRPLPADGPTTRRLQAGGAEAGSLVTLEDDQVSPFVALDGTWEAYRQEKRRKWSEAERKERKMGRDHEAILSIVEAPDDLEGQLARGFAVEASGWKGRAGTAIVSSPDTERFYREIAASFAAAGELALSEIRLDGRCVAFDLCLLHQERLYLLKTGFDESFGRLSPGLVLRQLVIRRCFALGLRTHELLGDESEWKARFQTGERRYASLRLMPRAPAEIARFGYRRHVRPRLGLAYRALRARAGR